jgi:hypothetical protein
MLSNKLKCKFSSKLPCEIFLKTYLIFPNTLGAERRIHDGGGGANGSCGFDYDMTMVICKSNKSEVQYCMVSLINHLGFLKRVTRKMISYAYEILYRMPFL